MEIADTEAMDFRHQLKQREVFLKKLLQELPGEKAWDYGPPLPCQFGRGDLLAAVRSVTLGSAEGLPPRCTRDPLRHEGHRASAPPDDLSPNALDRG